MKPTAIAPLFLLFVAGCTANVTEAEAPNARPDVIVTPRAEGATPDGASARYKIPLDGFPSIGSERALVTAVVFTDYGCPVCKATETRLLEERARRGDDLRVVVVHRPMILHKLSRVASAVAIAADVQGKFAETHARLLALEGKLDKQAILDAARGAGVDMARLEVDGRSDTVMNRARLADNLAERFDVRALPMILFNGKLVRAQTAEALGEAFEAEAAAARALVATGIPRDRVYATTVAAGKEAPLFRPVAEGTATNPIADHRAQIAKCWGEVKGAYPEDARQELTLEIKIRADGTLAAVDATPASPIATCVEKLPHTWSYRQTGADYTVKMSFGFTRRS